jgi:hypothetical protein
MLARAYEFEGQLERIRSRWVSQADRSLVESDLSEVLRLAESDTAMNEGDGTYFLGDLLLLRGFLLWERGDEPGAREAWRTGFAVLRKPMRERRGYDYNDTFPSSTPRSIGRANWSGATRN